MLSVCRMILSVLHRRSLGFRFLFVSIPFAFYSLGPTALVVSTALMVVFLYSWDHTVDDNKKNEGKYDEMVPGNVLTLDGIESGRVAGQSS